MGDTSSQLLTAVSCRSRVRSQPQATLALVRYHRLLFCFNLERKKGAYTSSRSKNKHGINKKFQSVRVVAALPPWKELQELALPTYIKGDFTGKGKYLPCRNICVASIYCEGCFPFCGRTFLIWRESGWFFVWEILVRGDFYTIRLLSQLRSLGISYIF